MYQVPKYRYVVVIARCRVQYGKYFPSFSYFATYLTAKYEIREKYLPILHEATCDNYFIVKCLFYLNKMYQELYNLMLYWHK